MLQQDDPEDAGNEYASYGRKFRCRERETMRTDTEKCRCKSEEIIMAHFIDFWRIFARHHRGL